MLIEGYFSRARLFVQYEYLIIFMLWGGGVYSEGLLVVYGTCRHSWMLDPREQLIQCRNGLPSFSLRSLLHDKKTHTNIPYIIIDSTFE